MTGLVQSWADWSPRKSSATGAVRAPASELRFDDVMRKAPFLFSTANGATDLAALTNAAKGDPPSSGRTNEAARPVSGSAATIDAQIMGAWAHRVFAKHAHVEVAEYITKHHAPYQPLPSVCRSAEVAALSRTDYGALAQQIEAAYQAAKTPEYVSTVCLVQQQVEAVQKVAHLWQQVSFAQSVAKLWESVLPAVTLAQQVQAARRNAELWIAREDNLRPDRDFQSYLNGMSAAGTLSALKRERVRAIWSLVRPHLGGMLPVAMPTSDGAMQLSWTRGNRHVSIDVYEDRWDWFFRDRSTDEVDGGDAADFESLSDAFMDRLELLG